MLRLWILFAAMERVGVSYLAERNFGHLSGGKVAAFGPAREALTSEPMMKLYRIPVEFPEPPLGRVIQPLMGD